MAVRTTSAESERRVLLPAMVMAREEDMRWFILMKTILIKVAESATQYWTTTM